MTGPRIRVAAVLQQEGRVLLVEHEKAGARYWLLPGGGVEFGESLEAALVREVREETGFEVSVGPLAMVLDSIAPDGRRHIVNLVFVGTITGGSLAAGRDGRVIGADFIAPEALRTMDVRPELRPELLEVVNGDAGRGARYLGVRWRDE